MKFIHLILLTAIFAASSAHSEEENRYNLIGRMIHPFASVFAKEGKIPHRAFKLTAKLEVMTDLPPAFAGAQVDVALQYPDKLKVHGPFLTDNVTLCRNGQDLWAYPGAKLDALMKDPDFVKKLPPLGSKAPLEPFELPIPEKELVLIPILFKVKDVASEKVDDAMCRVLDVYLMPEIAHSLKTQNWAARAWIREDAVPARISVARPGWQIAVRFENVEFTPKLPKETWEPTTEQAADILKLDPARFRQLLGAFVK